MKFKTLGNRNAPAVLFFHAMGVTGESSEPVANYLQDRYFCILPTSTVYCKGQKYVSKADEVRQVEAYLKSQGVERLELVVASSIGADLAMVFLTSTKLPIEHVFFDGGQFAQIRKRTRCIPRLLIRKHEKVSKINVFKGREHGTKSKNLILTGTKGADVKISALFLSPRHRQPPYGVFSYPCLYPPEKCIN